MTETKPNDIPAPPGRWRAITLAAVVHVALFAFLWFGVRWQSQTPVALVAEVWSPQVREAAPPPQPELEVKPEPKPEPRPVIADPKPAVIAPPAVNPDIALEQEKKRKLDEKKAREEERLEKKRADAKVEAEARKRLAAEDAKKEAAEKRRQLAAAEEQRLAKAHAEEMRRITGSGDAPKSQGSRIDGGYLQKVGAKIKSNTVFNVPDNVAGESAVEFAVELLPDGSLRGLRKIKSSGIAGFDEAVERAIKKSAPFPADKSGAVPAGFNVIHKPKDQ
jgi:colicin import membrane protein